VSGIKVTQIGDKEASDFASDIIQAIQAAGIRVDLNLVGVMASPMYGLTVVDIASGALRVAFEGAGIEQVKYAPNTSAVPSIFVRLKPPAF
jgi:hypothetical protein